MATEAEILTKLNDLLDGIDAVLDGAGASKLVTLDRATPADAALVYLRENGDERFRWGMPGGEDDFVIQHSPDGSPLTYADVFRIDGDTGLVTVTGLAIEGASFADTSFTGQSLFADGSAAAPSIANEGDTNTGLFFPAAGVIAAAADGSEVARFTSAGLGIGVSLPTDRLHVRGGKIRLDSTGSGVNGYLIRANVSDAVDGGLLIESLGGENLYLIQGGASGFHRWYVDDSEHMRLDSEGRLLVGTTINRGRLTIAGQGFRGYGIEHIAVGVSQESIISLLGTNDGGGASQQVHLVAYQPDGGGAADAALDFRVRGSVGPTFGDPGTIMTLLGSGRVGIDTALPIYPLDVVGALACTSPGTASVIAHSGDATNYSAVRFRQTSSESRIEAFRAGTGTATPLTFVVASGEAMRIDSSGNVLIGTTAPGASKLVVNDDSIQINSPKTPASATDTGATGQIAWDASYVYVCTAPDTWVRAALLTW